MNPSFTMSASLSPMSAFDDASLCALRAELAIAKGEAHMWIIDREDEGPHYDEYSSAMVIAETSEDAARIHPSGFDSSYGWAASPYFVKVRYVGLFKGETCQFQAKQPHIVYSHWMAGLERGAARLPFFVSVFGLARFL